MNQKGNPGRKRLAGRAIAIYTVAGIFVVSAAFAGAAVLSILTQTVPAGNTPASGFGPTCTTLSIDVAASGASSSTAEMVYNCTASGAKPAINVTSARAYTPTFTLPGAFTQAGLIPSNSAGSPTSTAASAVCSSFTGYFSITSGTPVSLSLGNYDYCFDSNTPGTSFASFSVSWS